MKKSLSTTKIFLTIFFCILFCLFLSSNKYGTGQKVESGSAIFPTEINSQWQITQYNPNIKNEEKVKSTINTFFLVKYEAWVMGTLLEFGFLFDPSDPQSYEDYVYERGLMYYMLEAWKYHDNLLASYEYKPKFYELKVEGQKATVMMRPKAGIVHRKTPSVVDNGPWTDYLFSLEHISGKWLIKSMRCNDELHEIYPHGTDFEQLAASLPDRISKYNAEVEAEHQERMLNDPEYREFIERRQKNRKGISSQKTLDPALLELYKKISGYYKIGDKLVLFIYLHNNNLMAKCEGNPEGSIMQKISGKSYEFIFKTKNGDSYYLKFLKDNNEKIIKCLIQKGESSFEAIKVNSHSVLKK